ncbi:MAG: hypothetical protein HQM11_14415 [SAR324 cluster bacterium]|nr:hypothetical protein [SAR324 cluster bacterium]
MPPLNYINMYIAAFVICLGGCLAGSFYFYNGMSDVSFVVATPSGGITYYLDRGRYDIYLKGFIYCLTFLVASGLFLSVIMVPSMGQVQQRMASPYSGGAATMSVPPAQARVSMPQAAPAAPAKAQSVVTPPSGTVVEKETPAKASTKMAAPVIEDEPEDLEEEDGDRPDRPDDSNEADVVYGSGRITPDSLVEFIHLHPDSAVKFLYSRSLDGKPLSNQEDEIYRGWQKRGLSKAKVRDYVMQIMEWDAVPNIAIYDIWSQLRDQIFELTH